MAKDDLGFDTYEMLVEMGNKEQIITKQRAAIDKVTNILRTIYCGGDNLAGDALEIFSKLKKTYG